MLMSQPQFNAPPGWPQPPPGWCPDAAWRPDPSWPPAPTGWNWWVTAAAPAYATGPAQQPASPPYNKGLRVFLTCLIVLGPLVLLVGLTFALLVPIDATAYPTPEAYDAAMKRVTDPLTALFALGCLIGYAVLAPKVSFRWFDTFCQLVPIYGYIWQFRIAWRLTGLSARDWAPRPEEGRGQAPEPGHWPGASTLPAPTSYAQLGGPGASTGFGSPGPGAEIDAPAGSSLASSWVGSLPPPQQQMPASQPGSPAAGAPPGRFG